MQIPLRILQVANHDDIHPQRRFVALAVVVGVMIIPITARKMKGRPYHKAHAGSFWIRDGYRY